LIISSGLSAGAEMTDVYGLRPRLQAARHEVSAICFRDSALNLAGIR
jgi:hypothetical protein